MQTNIQYPETEQFWPGTGVGGREGSGKRLQKVQKNLGEW